MRGRKISYLLRRYANEAELRGIKPVEIKYRMNPESSLPRSTDGYIWRYVSVILSYALIKKFF